MKAEFTALIQQLIAEQGRDALFNAAKCKAFLADYARGEYLNERRLLLQAVEADIPKAVADTNDLAACKQQCVKKLQDDYYLAPNVANGMVNLLSVLLGKETQQQIIKNNLAADVPQREQPVDKQNVRTAPAGQKKNAWQYFVGALKKLAVFKGRARRAEYWFFMLFVFVFTTIFMAIVVFITAACSIDEYIILLNNYEDTYSMILGIVLWLLSWAITVRRIHDCNKSGWFMLIPVYNIILDCTPGTVGPNRFGPDPKQP
jgi:uncharacterized membrane protein YhaH (DUF805 family)